MFLEASTLPKILLVDDQATVIHQLHGIVSDLAETYFATNGVNALEMVQVDQTIIRAIIQLAQGMNLRLVAEGVETLEHTSALRAMGCEIMQGFYYSRPLPLTDINRLLNMHTSLPEQLQQSPE